MISLARHMILLLCVLGCILRPVALHADTSRNINESQWRSLTDDKAFSYKDDKEQFRQPKTVKEGVFSRLLSELLTFLFGGGGILLACCLVVFIVGLIIYQLFSGNSVPFSRRRKVMSDTGPPTDMGDEDIATADWDALLQKSIANNDVRLAVRYSYMRLLQLLQQHELIQYRNDKTNLEYYSELQGTSYRQPFRQLSRQYEYAWYGHYDLPQPAFNSYLALFNNLKTQLGA